MQIDWFTFFAQVVNFLILLWLLKKFLYGPLLGVMKRREEKIASRLEEASSKLKEAEERSIEYQTKMDKLKEQKETLVREAKEEVESSKLKMMQEARNDVDSVYNKWVKEVEREKSLFLDELEEQVFQKIIDIVENIVHDLADLSLETKVVDQFMVRMKQLEEEEQKRIRETVDEQALEVATAFPTKEDDRKKIDRTIQQLLGSKKQCTYKQDPELGFGIEVRCNGWKIGWNMKTYLEELRSQVDIIFDHLELGSAEEVNSGFENRQSE